jgi:hypothetical protein
MTILKRKAATLALWLLAVPTMAVIAFEAMTKRG